MSFKNRLCQNSNYSHIRNAVYNSGDNFNYNEYKDKRDKYILI